MTLFAPAYSDARQMHADWLELYALTVADRSSSYEDLVGALRRSGTADAIERRDADRGSELTHQAADAAFSELDTRFVACGEGYPFDVTSSNISIRAGGEFSPYTFMLLLTHFGVSAGPRNVKGASHFEQLATRAAEEYLGGDAPGVGSFHFGFPRRLTPSGFAPALDTLCQLLHEGAGAKRSPRLRKAKDAKLDVIAWREFPDQRRGKLVAFGQCAAGDQWDAKATELVARKFSTLYLKEPLLLDPIRLFFVPRCLDEEEWEETVLDDVILFDRCRISAMLCQRARPRDLDRRTRSWCHHVLRAKLGVAA